MEKVRTIKKKTIALIIIVLAMVIFFVSMYFRSLSNKNTSGLVSASIDHTYSFFISAGENSIYYTDYAENPGIQYWCSKQFESENNQLSNVAFEFNAAPIGSESDTLNNLLGNAETWPDIVDMLYSSMTVEDAYESGFLIDLTPYIEECMPNYLAMLERYDIVDGVKFYADGEWRYLALAGFQDRDINTPWCGYQYRRDWIIKYGTPVSGSLADKEGGFHGYYSLKSDGTPCEISAEDYDASAIDGDSWVDNITFPSWERRDDADSEHGGMKWYADWCEENGKVWDGTDPVTISDWEWMFGFFKKAINEQNITDGYVHSIYYPGYIENGDFVTGFGGIGAHYYFDDDDYYRFGALEPGFCAYLQCMHSWYENGWIDKDFSTKRDAFYAIDNDLVRQGKVGCWYGRLSTLGARINSGELTKGIVVSTAAQPINDIYDAEGNAVESGRALTEDVAMSVPNCFFSNAEYSKGSVVFSQNLLKNGKDLKLLLRAINYLYSEEGSLLCSIGLTKEQLDDKNTTDYVRNIYEKYGVADGSYTISEDDGKKFCQRVPAISKDNELWTVLAPQRLNVGYMNKKDLVYDYSDTYRSMLEQYIMYENSAFVGGRLINYVLTDKENKYMSQTYSRITTTYLYQYVPEFITGKRSIETDWEEIRQGLITRGVEQSCEFNNKYIRELKGE